MRKLKMFFNKKNIAGILISGLVGFVALSLSGYGEKILALINKYRG